MTVYLISFGLLVEQNKTVKMVYSDVHKNNR